MGDLVRMKPEFNGAGIVADGAERIRSSATYRQRAREIRERIEEGRREEMARAGWLRLLFIRWSIRREVRKELEERCPPWALYSGVGSRILGTRNSG